MIRLPVRYVAGLLLALAAGGRLEAACGVRLLLGLTDSGPVRWDGSLTVTGGRLAGLEPWRFDLDDAVTGAASWRASTRRARLFSGGRSAPPPFVANGVIVWLEGESDATRLDVSTAQGSFNVALRDLPYGAGAKRLGGRVEASRIPPVSRITDSPEEQDFPAAVAGKSGEIWLAYIEFRHNQDHNQIRANFRARPASFDEMKAPTGGDQLLVRKFSEGRWSEPIVITPGGGDLYRAAIAVDGSGRPWVFWSQNRGGNFDVWARVIESGRPAAPLRISSEAGSDIDPVAATDSKGRVWVAWQGWRDGRASIFAAAQTGGTFSRPAVVASSSGNEWNPAIAADGNGRVTVAWDSYRNGNYDVYARTAAKPGAWGAELPVATSACYEAYPSIAYDRNGRLWIAYEEGAERWGKDWGAYATDGVSIYQGRAVRLVVLDPAGRFFSTLADPGDVLPGFPTETADAPGSQNEPADWLKPSPRDASKRKPNDIPPFMRGPRNSLPRLLVDASGRLWLAFRSSYPLRWSVIGYVWAEHVVSYDGVAWSRPIYLARSGNLLDNRPALVSTRPGELTVIGATDGRDDFQKAMAGSNNALFLQNAQPSASGKAGIEDPYNNDLYASRIVLGPATRPPGLKPAAAPLRAAADPMDSTEVAAAKRLREHRIANLRILRGEFHRHSEVSPDGGSDGSLSDQWRYMIDAARMDWLGCCDHDNGGGREYSWWITQKLTDVFNTPGKLTSLFSYERSMGYPEGHRNVVFAERGIRPLPRLPRVSAESTGHAPDTQMLYAYLRQFGGVVASHSSGTGMGTDWRDNDPEAEPVVELYQGMRQNYEMPGAPRAMTEQDTIGGYRPKGFVSLALEMGHKLSFEASSDHLSTHMSYSNILAADNTRAALLDALRKRHVYAATDDILADVRSGPHIMGDVFSTRRPPELDVLLVGTASLAKVHIIRDNRYVYSIEPRQTRVEFTWRDNSPRAGATSFYYVRGEQVNGEIVWASPMWIRYEP